MSKEIKLTDEHDIGLYDSATGDSIAAEKAVDITEDCPSASERNRAVLLFARAKRGRIVQIARPYHGEVYMGSHIHFFIDELDHEMRVSPWDDTFGSTASLLGLTKKALRSLIETNAPH